MDTGDYEAALDKVLEVVDVDALRAEQAARIDDPTRPLLGIGWAAYVEITNPLSASEFGSCEIRSDGTALLLTGSSAHGQGHYTTFAQLASELTGIPVDKIEVRHGDTDEVKRGGGTGGSRSLQVGGTAIWEATKTVVEQAKEVAADVLEANPADIILDTSAGTFAVTGSPSVAIGWAEVAAQAADANQPLAAENDFQPPRQRSRSACISPLSTSTATPARSGSCGTRPATTPASSSTPPSSTVRSTAAWPAASARP
jgi:carbon-monoxide dehydrogenase large subunit